MSNTRFTPSLQIDSLLTVLGSMKDASKGINAMTGRLSEFPSRIHAQLTGIALDPRSRAAAEEFMDDYWADESRHAQIQRTRGLHREIIIGSGVHAAVYAAVRVMAGHPKPLVVERNLRVGGSFAATTRPTFRLNSRNRPGNGGMAGDQRFSLNYLPGAPIQAANVSMCEYQDNTDIAFVIRLTLAQFADVLPGRHVVAAYRDGNDVVIELDGVAPLYGGRVLDARGLGDPTAKHIANGTTILTFPQFMDRMGTVWPLRGLRQVAVIGGGDAARCAVESFLGIAPQPLMASATLDSVDRIDWYSDTLPTTCEEWQEQIRGRYQAIGRYLRPDRLGTQRLTVINRRVQPVDAAGMGVIDGRTYDLVVMWTGNGETTIPGLGTTEFTTYKAANGNIVAREHTLLPAFRIGPHAALPFTFQEIEDGLNTVSANAVSIFRTAPMTAALAATLPATPLHQA